MHGYAFPSRHGTAKTGSYFRAEARRRKPSNPYMHGNAEAELWRSEKARMRFPDSVGIRPCRFP
ncbi:hypothetical protein FA378_05225 [Pseudomonas aeruginosa]|nr:hypothetical protein [Pseudomonas aeruginosa]MCO2757448.1 hypothetical protein [Pseudomonas aeruginosa]MCO2763788.1 hypothetical protein [Pseudomonas aeruginosa]MCO2771466.1 hypothetical protein [Pseudomonas aeruginosa]QEK84854.1 hypothetical protein FQ758_07785 [Pseudomonas aeruginosa]